MPLPSQSRRYRTRRRYSLRRRRRHKRRRRPLLAALLLVAVVALWGVWQLRDAGEGFAAAQPEPAMSVALRPAADADRPTGMAGPTDGRLEGAPPAARIDDPPVVAAPAATRQDPARRSEQVEVRDRPRGYRPTPSPGTEPPTVQEMEIGLDLIARNKPVEARRWLTAAVESAALDPAGRDRARHKLARLNHRLVFSPEIVAGDPFALAYVIKPGDMLSKIAKAHGLHTDWRFIKRINRIPADRNIRVGQRIKLITGPFHAVVAKADYRLDLYLGEGSSRVFVASFPVGLGEYNSTPVGMFRVHPLHQARQLLARLLNNLVAQMRRQQRQCPRMTLHRFDQIFDGLTRRRVGVQRSRHARS